MISFKAIHDLIEKVKSLNEVSAWKFAIDKETQTMIISLNTEDQLGEFGIDANGDSLGDYAPFTVNVRTEMGLQTGHIDFKQTGAYWESWRVDVDDNQYTLLVDKERFDELVNELRFSEDHVGVTDENMKYVIDLITDKYVDYIKQRLLS